MLALCQDGMTLVRLPTLLHSTDRATTWVDLLCAIIDRSSPLMSKVTLPYQMFIAARQVVMCSAWVLATELSSNSRKLGGKGVVLTQGGV